MCSILKGMLTQKGKHIYIAYFSFFVFSSCSFFCVLLRFFFSVYSVFVLFPDLSLWTVKDIADCEYMQARIPSYRAGANKAWAISRSAVQLYHGHCQTRYRGSVNQVAVNLYTRPYI